MENPKSRTTSTKFGPEGHRSRHRPSNNSIFNVGELVLVRCEASNERLPASIDIDIQHQRCLVVIYDEYMNIIEQVKVRLENTEHLKQKHFTQQRYHDFGPVVPNSIITTPSRMTSS
ncbi:unnamed protein product [Didymodactylos carnosus]|uniref:Uncharacterized protein n=1 Tax=Didymodactylos carnosus TaxID=1234261 RepID=A0A815R6G1_9BILA|nr:unnamed protein product [Didymodactylos carnosus]CAF1472573.1 unnamed protein product [Didymodactylos carnosus]CAF4230456.1 unnamed protein product [Didymodactylos carnosus]CAF4339760.1 unnamed protein product [Didymodactylos carnosus]